MGSRMDKYKKEDLIPTRSDKNQELYKQVYNAYDEFENLIVPSNAREIDPKDLKKEITSRQDYRKQKELDSITNNTNNRIVRKEKIQEVQKKENEVYDINELLNKAVEEKKQPELVSNTFSNDDYLKKLKLDNRRTNIEQVKEIYEDIQEETMMEDESLMKTANLSLEILSDLKGDSDKTIVSAPIKDDELPEEDQNDFYSNTYKFSKKDFDDKDNFKNDDEFEEDDEDDNQQSSSKFFFKILMLIFGILLIVLILLYFINYFNRV